MTDKGNEPAKYLIEMNQPQGSVIGDYAHVEQHFHTVPSPPPATRDELLAAIREANVEMRDYRDEIAEVHIDRAEVEQIVEWIHRAGPKECLGIVLDQPGSGKTVVMHDVLVRLEDEDVPVLAIKADFLSGIRTPNDLAVRLGLPATVEECGRHLANEGLFVVLLDQLDALSLSLTRDQTTLDIMLSTLAHLRNMDNVRIIASCRSFDLNNDPRLSQIKEDHRFQLQPLSDEQIAPVLQVIGVDPNRLLPAHKVLLSTPLHLDIYARIAADNSDQSLESYHTVQELYEALWRKRIEVVPPDSPRPAERIAAIYQLVEAMQNNRQIAVPTAILDAHPEAATYLEGVNFIRREGRNWLFFHQTLFDYCYARRFIAQGRSLSQEILGGPQGLFERSQMVQVLAYLRGADETVYRRELTALLFSDKLRPHLDLLLMGWFGSLPNPSTGERQIALRLMKKYEEQSRFFRAISGNEGWFEQLGETSIPTMLHSNENQQIDLAVGFLATLINLRIDDVLSYLKPFLGANEDWNNRIIQILRGLENWYNEIAMQMLCELIISDQTFGYEGLCLQQLGKSNPANGCRVLRVYLDKRLDDLLQHEASGTELENAPRRGRMVRITDRHSWDRYLLGEYSVDTILNEANEKCPEKIIEHLLPWFKETCETLSDVKNSDQYSFDPVFSSFWYGDHLSKGPKFARQIAHAVQQIAQTDPPAFRSLASDLALTEALSIHRVLVRGYLTDPNEYANDACTYLISDPRRVNIGEPLESPHYDSRRLYAAIFPHLNHEFRKALEEFVLSLNPAWELRGRGRHGITQLRFLKSVPIELLGETARRRRQELENKFPDFRLMVPQGITGGAVGPPIKPEAQAKMSDEAWLGAMRKYNDDTEWDGPKEHFLKGGVIELSRSFTEQVKQDPERFYHLAQRFDETISLHYVAAAITGLAESAAPAEWTFDLVRHFADRLEGEFRRYVCWALLKRTEDE